MKHEFITCDKAGCGKTLQPDAMVWDISCRGVRVGDDLRCFKIQALHLCPTCYEDVCAFIYNKGEVKDDKHANRTTG